MVPTWFQQAARITDIIMASSGSTDLQQLHGLQQQQQHSSASRRLNPENDPLFISHILLRVRPILQLGSLSRGRTSRAPSSLQPAVRLVLFSLKQGEQWGQQLQLWLHAARQACRRWGNTGKAAGGDLILPQPKDLLPQPLPSPSLPLSPSAFPLSTHSSTKEAFTSAVCHGDIILHK